MVLLVSAGGEVCLTHGQVDNLALPVERGSLIFSDLNLNNLDIRPLGQFHARELLAEKERECRVYIQQLRGIRHENVPKCCAEVTWKKSRAQPATHTDMMQDISNHY